MEVDQRRVAITSLGPCYWVNTGHHWISDGYEAISSIRCYCSDVALNSHSVMVRSEESSRILYLDLIKEAGRKISIFPSSNCLFSSRKVMLSFNIWQCRRLSVLGLSETDQAKGSRTESPLCFADS